jgi:type I restriction enzyme R subunit
MPDFAEKPEWNGSIEASKDFIWSNGLRFLRHYQLKAIRLYKVQLEKEKQDSYLNDGTGKTLTSAAVIRLFRTQNARQFLFLVDRLELEDQA